MKFGKLPSIENVDFTLPTPPKETEQVLHAIPPTTQKPKAYIGCTGWSMKEWVGRVYPTGTKAADYLKYYANQFNTIELNTTHYRIPTISTVKKWVTTAKDDFRFCPKILQQISHSKDLGLSSTQIIDTKESFSYFEEKMGCCFMQLPPFFGADRIGMIERFLNKFPEEIPLSIELRHESWYEENKNIDDVYQLLKSKNVATVITDVAGRRDILHMRLTNNICVVRFVGNGLHPTDYTRIDDWVQQLKIWFEMGLQKVYFFTHEPDNLLAPELALYMVEKMKEHCDVITRGPTFYEEDSDRQISLF